MLIFDEDGDIIDITESPEKGDEPCITLQQTDLEDDE